DRSRLPEGMARSREGFQEQAGQGGGSHLLVLHLEGLHVVEGHLQQGARTRRGTARLAERPQALYAGAGRNPAQGKQDQGYPRLGQSAAYRLPQAGKRLTLLHHLKAGAESAGLSTTTASTGDIDVRR